MNNIKTKLKQCKKKILMKSFYYWYCIIVLKIKRKKNISYIYFINKFKIQIL